MAPPIVVPVDGQPAAEHALPVAVRLARRLGAPLRLVRVHGIVYTEDRKEVRPVEEYMRALTERVRGEAGVPVDSVLLEGNPATELTRYVREEGGSLIVLSTDPKGTLERLVSGSVSEALIRAGGPPLLLVRGGTGTIDEAVPYRRVIVALDGSAGSERALAAARESGVLADAHATLLHVPEDGGGADQPAVPDPRAYLGEVAGSLEGAVGRVDTVVTDEKNPARAIQDAARREGADLIVMATHGRGGLREALFGGTAREVLRSATTDLFLARHP